MKILGNIPRNQLIHVACSGGSDSMVLVDFLLKYPKVKFDILYFNHGTECCQEAQEFLIGFCSKNKIDLKLGRITRDKDPDESQEEYWRKERYEFLSKFSDKPIFMAHHLNDVIETWTMTALQGKPKLIPYFNRRYNIYRPFLCVPKSEINSWSERHGVKYVLDRSNFDTSIRRNYVRHAMMEHIYHVSPGIEKILVKKLEEEYKSKFCSYEKNA